MFPWLTKTSKLIKKVELIILVFECFLVCHNQAQIPSEPSPCPKIFQYDSSRMEEPGRWYGQLTIKTEYALSELWIRVFFNQKVQLVGTTFDSVETDDNINYLFSNATYTFLPSDTLKIPFFVRFSLLDPVPQITEIRLNGRPICAIQLTKSLPPPVNCRNFVVVNESDTENSGKWFGSVYLQHEEDLNDVSVNVHLDTVAQLVGSRFGPVESEDNQEFLIKNTENTFKANTLFQVPIFVKYSLISPIPNVNRVQLNGITICDNSDPSDSNSNDPQTNNNNVNVQLDTITEQTTRTTLEISSSTENETKKPDDKFVLPPFRCGIRELGERIFFGIPTTIEQHPWHGAIFHENDYICGMSLISSYHALTAAHCFYNKYQQPVNLTSIRLHFGLSNLRRVRSINVQTVQIKELFRYPNYEFHTPMYDVAVVKFDRQIKFNERVQPVCLWGGNIDLHSIQNQYGTVIGFGLTEIGTNSDQLLWGRILVVDSETCREIDQKFYGTVLSKFSYCAGNLTQSSVCRGDSGGGMFFQKPGTEIWEIRGITSTSRPSGISCDNNYYAVFTDVAKYRDWIRQQMCK